jgi:hypothetical protein
MLNFRNLQGLARDKVGLSMKAHRVLKPGGMIVGVFLNVLSYCGSIAHLAVPLRGEYDYYRSAYVTWRNELRKHGFCLLHEEGLC